jgi:Rod binding domain-containing protein
MIPAIRPTDGGGGEADRLRGMPAQEAATAVEGIFVSMLVSEMKKTLDGGGFFGDAPGSAVFDGMFDRMMGEELAKKGGFGLAAFVSDTLKAQAGARQAATPRTDLEGTPQS